MRTVEEMSDLAEKHLIQIHKKTGTLAEISCVVALMQQYLTLAGVFFPRSTKKEQLDNLVKRTGGSGALVKAMLE